MLREEQQREAALKQQQQQQVKQTPVKATTTTAKSPAPAPPASNTPITGKTLSKVKTPSVHSPQVVLDAQAKAAADMKRRLDERLEALKKPSKGPASR